MDILSIILIAIALAMDAFAVSISKGFYLTKKQILWFGIFFGGFQALMPILGYFTGTYLEYYVSAIAPWIAFLLLIFIGIKMIYESIQECEDSKNSEKFSFKELTVLAIATSIDAFAVGVTFAMLNTSILIPVILIGVITFLFSEIGIIISKKMDNFFGNKFEIIGGLILILLGFRILI